MALDTEKMVDEALAMKLAVTGDRHGDYFHAFNWADKPHRVIYDATKIINEAAAELATLRAENAALKNVIDDLPDYIEAFRAFKENGCKSRRDYAQVVEDIVGIARESKEALK